MAIKVTLSAGITSAKTTSLFQWDYGQQLEIVSDDLPPIVEVHFACKGMSEAVVVPCSITDGTGIVTIPDSCLEQSTDITAWVYSIEGTQGKTVKTITIPIVARIRPGRSETIPQGFSDQYTELISQINDAIGDLKDGSVTVKKAETADLATKAASATNASFANTANTANTANGVTINGKTPFPAPTERVTHLPGAGYYCVVINDENKDSTPVLVYWLGKGTDLSIPYRAASINVDDMEILQLCLVISETGEISVKTAIDGMIASKARPGCTFDVAKLWG